MPYFFGLNLATIIYVNFPIGHEFMPYLLGLNLATIIYANFAVSTHTLTSKQPTPF